MTALANRAVTAYSALEIETGVAGASPLRLVVMLYDGALKAIYTAKVAMERGEIAAKGSAISKAIAIIDEGLRPALDLDAGGELAANLMALYQYITGRLLFANLKNDKASLDEAARLLSELRSAWEALEQGARPPEQDPAANTKARGRVAVGKR
ncbi:MAG TPA: flagellar export chaperone FliS [Burkholderiales bacterium]|nr:flagellar export chaperone FliS [Burkholderiales bacterium]